MSKRGRPPVEIEAVHIAINYVALHVLKMGDVGRVIDVRLYTGLYCFGSMGSAVAIEPIQANKSVTVTYLPPRLQQRAEDSQTVAAETPVVRIET